MSEPAKPTETAQEALDQIIGGIRRFREEVYPDQRELYKKLAHEQKPRAMFITCADSRIIPELITQSSPGDLFVTRNVGNVVPPYGQMNGGVSTAIEFAVMALGVQHIIICGHSDCGAMKAVLNPAELRRMPTVKAWLLHSEVAKTVVERNCGCADHNTLGILTKENVVGQLFIHGWVYDIETSEILAYDADRGEFRPIGDGPVPMATPKPRYHPDQD